MSAAWVHVEPAQHSSSLLGFLILEASHVPSVEHFARKLGRFASGDNVFVPAYVCVSAWPLGHTLLTSHVERSSSKFVAPANIESMFVTLAVFQFEMPPLTSCMFESLKSSSMLVTCEVSHEFQLLQSLCLGCAQHRPWVLWTPALVHPPGQFPPPQLCQH